MLMREHCNLQSVRGKRTDFLKRKDIQKAKLQGMASRRRVIHIPQNMVKKICRTEDNRMVTPKNVLNKLIIIGSNFESTKCLVRNGKLGNLTGKLITLSDPILHNMLLEVCALVF